jgi:hypothetical protein
MQNSRKGPNHRHIYARNGAASARPSSGGNGFGNAKRNYQRYLILARAAKLAGDIIEMENCYQHADHFFRMMRALEPASAIR